MSVLEPIMRQIDKLWATIRGMPQAVVWGTVTQSSPLRVRLDGEAEPIPFTPATVQKNIPVGARVLCVKQNLRVIILAVAGGNNRGLFDLGTARLEYGGRASRPVSASRVMQSVQVVDSLGGEIWYSQVGTGTASGRESTVVVRCTPAGALIDEMTFTDAGHGTGMFVEVDGSGTPWVWLSFINHAVASGQGRYNYVRVQWAAGATRTWSNVSSQVVPALTRPTYLTTHFDERTGQVGIRDNPAGGRYQFSRHDLAALKAGTWAPVDVIDYTPPSDWYAQGWALLDGTWFLLSGSSTVNSPVYPARIIELDRTGAVVTERSIEGIRTSPLGNAVGGFTEPEGLVAGRGANGEPALILGVSAGPVGGRAYTFWTLHSGATPFVNTQYAQDGQWGDTGWTGDLFTSTGSGFTVNTTSGQKFEGRVAAGYLELDGVIDGTFAAGQNIVGQLRPGYYSPVKIRRAPVAKSLTGGSTTARLEISNTGEFRVWLESADASVTWIDFTGVRVPLFIDRGVSA